MKPCKGKVWWDDGRPVDATVRGTWNGFAVARVSKAAALDLFSQLAHDGYTVRDAGSAVEVEDDSGMTHRLAVKGGRVDLGDGWALNYSCERK